MHFANQTERSHDSQRKTALELGFKDFHTVIRGLE